jgi:hypothetical protein
MPSNLNLNSASQTNAPVSPRGKTIITLQLAQSLADEATAAAQCFIGKEMGGLKKNQFC